MTDERDVQDVQAELGRWIAVGLVLGAAVGLLLGNLAIGIGIGLALGAGHGATRLRRDEE